ncbi:MAG: cytochrome c family protein [Rhodobacteraceae bacterium]|jgi:cytochrome c|nr:cytochrome c family protein [Paracoccaceae bacterium]
MFDTMTLTKAVGSLCAALLVFLLGKWAAETVYHMGGHGAHEQAYVIDTGAGDAPAAAEEEVPFEVVFASADAAAGERVFRACASCHKLDGTDGTGPHLNGVVGRPAESVAGFAYSGALAPVVDVWTPEHLNGFLTNPRSYAPGNKMSYNGMADIEDRANLIAYLAATEG